MYKIYNYTSFFLILFSKILCSKLSYIKFLNNKILEACVSSKNYFYVLSILFMCSLFRFRTLIDLIVVDFYNKTHGMFGISFLLCSHEFNVKLIIHTIIFSFYYLISIESYFKNSLWSQREIQEMFGIFFFNSNDTRRLLTDYSFQGFCLRKDFPLIGYFEVRYDDEYLTLLTEKIELIQDFRFFNIKNVWEIN